MSYDIQVLKFNDSGISIHPYLSRNRKQFQVVLLFFVTLSIFNTFNEREKSPSSIFPLPVAPRILTRKAAAKLKQL